MNDLYCINCGIRSNAYYCCEDCYIQHHEKEAFA